MAITLFSMLADAHALNIGLVDITQNSLYIGDDHGLYFDGFQACIPLDEEDAVHNRSWMDLKALKCPGKLKYIHVSKLLLHLIFNDTYRVL